MASEEFNELIEDAARQLAEGRAVVVRIEGDSASIEAEAPDGEIYTADEMGIDPADTPFDVQLLEAVEFVNRLE